jgi:hypothetical protein
MAMDTRLRSVGLVAFALCLVAVSHAADVGAKVAFTQNAPLPFAKFTLTFAGERRVASEKFSRGMILYDFRVVSPQGRSSSPGLPEQAILGRPFSVWAPNSLPSSSSARTNWAP